MASFIPRAWEQRNLIGNSSPRSKQPLGCVAKRCCSSTIATQILRRHYRRVGKRCIGQGTVHPISCAACVHDLPLKNGSPTNCKAGCCSSDQASIPISWLLFADRAQGRVTRIPFSGASCEQVADDNSGMPTNRQSGFVYPRPYFAAYVGSAGHQDRVSLVAVLGNRYRFLDFLWFTSL